MRERDDDWWKDWRSYVGPLVVGFIIGLIDRHWL